MPHSAFGRRISGARSSCREWIGLDQPFIRLRLRIDHCPRLHRAGVLSRRSGALLRDNVRLLRVVRVRAMRRHHRLWGGGVRRVLRHRSDRDSPKEIWSFTLPSYYVSQMGPPPPASGRGDLGDGWCQANATLPRVSARLS
jgi:hypothetical protein